MGERKEVFDMPQMNKDGKFIFGKSVIREDGTVQIPAQAVDEYRIAEDGKVYLFTGSKIIGGFCVTRRGVLAPSKLGHILTETPELLNYTSDPGAFIRYKGRFYCWTDIFPEGKRYDGFFEDCSGNEAAFHTQQRYCVYDGRKGAAAGKSPKL